MSRLICPGSDDIEEVTEIQLERYMALHEEELSGADEYEHMREAGAAIMQSYAKDPPQLFGELLRLWSVYH